ncbi:MAG: hypothetical protein PUJ19_00345 [Campylobacteraceae bacterium]|nr:hypothetical protein [Campylobacteraceae bacterium]
MSQSGYCKFDNTCIRLNKTNYLRSHRDILCGSLRQIVALWLKP